MKRATDTSTYITNQQHHSSHTLEEKAEFVFGLINGKGRARLILLLRNNGAMRFNEIQRSLDDISPSLLANNLKSLSLSKIVIRKPYASVPPKVTYTLTANGLELSGFIISSAGVFDRVRDDKHRLSA